MSNKKKLFRENSPQQRPCCKVVLRGAIKGRLLNSCARDPSHATEERCSALDVPEFGLRVRLAIE